MCLNQTALNNEILGLNHEVLSLDILCWNKQVLSHEAMCLNQSAQWTEALYQMGSCVVLHMLSNKYSDKPK